MNFATEFRMQFGGIEGASYAEFLSWLKALFGKKSFVCS